MDSFYKFDLIPMLRSLMLMIFLILILTLMVIVILLISILFIYILMLVVLEVTECCYFLVLNVVPPPNYSHRRLLHTYVPPLHQSYLGR
jgi:hypothetical protein